VVVWDQLEESKAKAADKEKVLSAVEDSKGRWRKMV